MGTSYLRASSFAVAVTLSAAAGCSGARPARTPDGGGDQNLGPTCEASNNPKLDLLFVVDDTTAPEQVKFRDALPGFFQTLNAGPMGAADLHVAVITSSMGAGAFDNVTGCTPASGDLDGTFQAKPGCPGARDGQSFAVAGLADNNFDGELAALVGCWSDVGQNGCGFEQPLAAMRRALERGSDAGDPTNGGFLRSDAYLAVVMMTDEDDCSVPRDSTLFDPDQQRVSQPLGGQASYRCTEFGILCNGQPPPHTPAQTTMLTNCVPAEEKGRLTPVASFVSFLLGLKPQHQARLFLGALAGPTTPFAVSPQDIMLGDGTTEEQPRLLHSCTSGNAGTEYADPAVRIGAATAAFGSRGSLQPICTETYQAQMQNMALGIRALFGPCP